MKPTSQIPSPQATGGAGPSYEQHVDAGFLAVLLTGGVTPFCSECALTEVHLQARHLGWMTDDLLLVGQDPQGTPRRVAIQAKRTFALAASDEECVKTFRAAWGDFTNATLFNEAQDRLVLVTGQAPTNFTRGMRTLLDAAHAALDAKEFAHRVASYVSKEARHCYETVSTILRAHAGETASEDAVWRFLRVWDFSLLDFQSPSSVAEGLVQSLLAATSNDPATQATDTWNALLHLASEESGHAKSFKWGSLPQELRVRHRLPATAERDTFETLRLASNLVREAVVDRLAGTFALPRPQVVADAIALFTDVDALLVTGPAGSGKSVIAAKLFDALAGGTLALAFRADTLATPHLATSALHVGLRLRPLVRLFALHERKLLWVEGGERLFEKDAPEREAFSDLLHLLSHERGWKLLITCRDYSVEKFRTAFLEPIGLRSTVLAVTPLSESELEEAASALPSLRVPLAEPVLHEVLRNPFYLNLAARMVWPEPAPQSITRRAFREKAWREVVSREDEAADGMPLERDRTMVEVALRRARALVPYVTVEGLPAPAVHALMRDSLLAPNPDDAAQFAPAHDVFEDWALLQWLRRLCERTAGVNAALFAELGTHPALRRAFRLWLLELLDAEWAEAEQWVLAVTNDSALPMHWRDEALVAVFQCSRASRALPQLAPQLLAGGGTLLRRAVHLLRVACRKTPQASDKTVRQSPSALVPDGTAWDVMPLVLSLAVPLFKTTDILWLLGFLEDWVEGAREHTDPPGAREVEKLCEVLLSCAGRVNYRYQHTYNERVLRVLLCVPRAAESTLRTLVDKALARPRGDWESGNALKLVWSHFSGAAVCRELPDLTTGVVEQQTRLGMPTERGDELERIGFLRMEVNDVFGVGHLSDIEHYPASAWQGPFLNLLTYHPERGIEASAAPHQPLLRSLRDCPAKHHRTTI